MQPCDLRLTNRHKILPACHKRQLKRKYNLRASNLYIWNFIGTETSTTPWIGADFLPCHSFIEEELAESWKGIDERKGLETLLIATNDGRGYTLELRCRGESREVQCSLRRGKREFAIELVRYRRSSWLHIPQHERTCMWSRIFWRFFEGINGRLLIHDHEQLKWWKNGI